MTPDTQYVMMIKKLVMAPKPLKTKAGAWYSLLKLENRVRQEDGSWKHGPAFIVILRGRPSEPGMPIYTAKAGCVVCVMGRLSSIWTPKGVSTVVESGWVNVILHPGASKYMKFAQTPSAPPMNSPIDMSELDDLVPDNGMGALEEMLAAMGARSAEDELEFTENLLTEQISKRLRNEKTKSATKSYGSERKLR